MLIRKRTGYWYIPNNTRARRRGKPETFSTRTLCLQHHRPTASSDPEIYSETRNWISYKIIKAKAPRMTSTMTSEGEVGELKRIFIILVGKLH